MPYDDRELEEYAKVFAGPTFVKNLQMLKAPFAASSASLASQVVAPCTCDENDLAQGAISKCCECCRPSAPAMFGGVGHRAKGRPHQILESSSIINILKKYQPYSRDGQGTSPDDSASETRIAYSGSNPSLSAIPLDEFDGPGTRPSSSAAIWSSRLQCELRYRSPLGDFELGRQKKVTGGIARPDSTVIDAGFFSNDETRSRIKAGQPCEHPQDVESLSDEDDPENPRQLLDGGYGGREYVDFEGIPKNK